jgi:hypothetical protein
MLAFSAFPLSWRWKIIPSRRGTLIASLPAGGRRRIGGMKFYDHY